MEQTEILALLDQQVQPALLDRQARQAQLERLLQYQDQLGQQAQQVRPEGLG